MSFKEMQELSTELKLLQCTWADRFPNRARGGRVAIAGFRYQFYLFLYHLILEWLSYSPDERNSIEKFLTEMEALSDIITIKKDRVIIATQSKITLRSSSLIDALEEFKTIHETAEEVSPLLVGCIKYRILCSKLEVKNIDDTISNWKGKQQNFDNTNLFINSIEVKSESSPENRLLSLLANNLKCPTPLKIVHKWIGLVVDGVKSYDSMEFAGKIIWDDLTSLKRNSIDIKDSIYLWQDIDFPPDIISNGPVLIGQRPNVIHLRKGYFSKREKVYSMVEDSLLSLIDSRYYSVVEKMPIYWIGGRSGSGKSVALLHILATLNEKGYGPIIWVGHQTSLLYSAVKYALELEQTTCIPIIGVDDPYVVGVENNVSQHWEDVFAFLHSYRQNGNYESLPMFIACGPTEQAYLFKDDYCEYLEFNIKELPQESIEERQSLREWYKQRTGNEPPSIDDTNTLMVQQFFQWDRHQSIIEFAKRLRDRLIQGDQSKGVYNLVSRVISLNRLYIGYAAAAVKNNLTIEQKDLLEWLEKDLHLGEREQNGMNGYWLLHAHLANALYLNWFENRPAAFIEHLKAGIIDSITFGNNPNERTAPLWAISRVFRQAIKDDLVNRINENMAEVLLKEIYNIVLKDNRTISTWMLPVWVEIYSLKPELDLEPSPIESAIEIIKPCFIGETGLGLLCHKIMQYHNTFDFETQQKINNVIVRLLEDKPHWNEWFHITKGALTILKDERLIPIIISSVSNNSGNNMDELLYLAIKEWPNDKKILDFTLEMLSEAPCSFFWVEIVKECIKNSNQDLNINVILWLQRHNDNRYICFALKEAIIGFYDKVRDIVMHWSSLWNHLNYASFILEPVLEYESTNMEVIDWCCNWLVTATGDKSFMLEKLLKNPNVSPRIVEIAIDWLKDVNAQNPSWLFVWEALNNINFAEISSLDLGLDWLKQNHISHITWPFFWNNLNKLYPNEIALIELGIKWIKQADVSHPLWVKIFKKLLDVAPRNSELINIGQEWFKQKDISYNAWPYMWQSFYKNDPSNLILESIAKKWLKETSIGHSAWYYVWSAIIKSNNSDIEIFNIGVHWISKVEVNHKMWRMVWEILIKISPNNNELIYSAEKWLKSVDYNTSSWYHVWKKLYKSNFTDKENLLEMGKVWLTKVDQSNAGWVHIWDSVYKSDLSNIPLFNMGINFLRVTAMESGTWSNIWLLLIKAKPEDEYLYKAGFEWTNKISMHNGAWGNIWLSLTKARPLDMEVYKIGVKWICSMNLNNTSWQYIWMRLFDLKPQNPKVLELGIKWLTLKNNITGAWPEVFRKIIQLKSNNPNLIRLGSQWLEEVPLNNSLWSSVWLGTIQLELNNSRLLKLGYIWLKQSSKNAKTWPNVWSILALAYPSDTELMNIGLEWITENSNEHPFWEKVYEILDKQTKE